MQNRIFTLFLSGLVFMGTAFAQSPQIINLEKYGITVSEEQKARILSDLRQASPWIPTDSSVEIKLQAQLSISDNVNLPFVNDTDLIGTWNAIAFVETPEAFDPAVTQNTEELFWTSLTVKPAGKCGRH